MREQFIKKRNQRIKVAEALTLKKSLKRKMKNQRHQLLRIKAKLMKKHQEEERLQREYEKKINK